MATRIYVGSLSFSTTDDQLLQLFSTYGEVTEATVAVDRYTTQSKGFGFVQMSDDAAAQQAITALNGTALDGRTINVSLAKPRAERSDSRTPRSDGYRERRW
jgi:RNA recognition motif-containing protein